MNIFSYNYLVIPIILIISMLNNIFFIFNAPFLCPGSNHLSFVLRIEWDIFLGARNRNQICCRAAPCGAARGPFNHFEIRVNSNLKVLTRILKWSNGSRAAPHRAARQWIRVRSQHRTKKSCWKTGLCQKMRKKLTIE
jgi:hypothetical protein